MAKTRIISSSPMRYGFDLLAFAIALFLLFGGALLTIAFATRDRIDAALASGLACVVPGVVVALYVPFHVVRTRGTLILEDEWLLFRSVFGRVRGQIPLRNVAKVELVWRGQQQLSRIVGVGIDLRDRRDPDTWWHGPSDDSHDIVIWNTWNIEPSELRKALTKRIALFRDET